MKSATGSVTGSPDCPLLFLSASPVSLSVTARVCCDLSIRPLLKYHPVPLHTVITSLLPRSSSTDNTRRALRRLSVTSIVFFLHLQTDLTLLTNGQQEYTRLSEVAIESGQERVSNLYLLYCIYQKNHETLFFNLFFFLLSCNLLLETGKLKQTQ